MRVTRTLQGAAALKKALASVIPKHVRPALKKGTTEAAQLILDAARSNLTRERTGALRKSLGKKVVPFKDANGYLAIVGPRRDLSDRAIAKLEAGQKVGKRTKAPGRRHKGRDIVVNPAKYAHLVEYGRGMVRVRTKKVLAGGGVVYGSVVRADPGDPFLRPAYDGNARRGQGIIAARTAAAIRAANKGA